MNTFQVLLCFSWTLKTRATSQKSCLLLSPSSWGLLLHSANASALMKLVLSSPSQGWTPLEALLYSKLQAMSLCNVASVKNKASEFSWTPRLPICNTLYLRRHLKCSGVGPLSGSFSFHGNFRFHGNLSFHALSSEEWENAIRFPTQTRSLAKSKSSYIPQRWSLGNLFWVYINKSDFHRELFPNKKHVWFFFFSLKKL